MVNQPSRILIVDDHPLVRTGLRNLIETEPDLTICAEAGSVRDALKAARDEKPDLALIDISLEDGNGIELVRRIKQREQENDAPELRLLVCSMHEETLFAQRAINAGAHGYVNKHELPEQVLKAIRQVLAGRVYLSEKMVGRLIDGLGNKKSGGVASVEDLSDRELEVFRLIGQGRPTSKIAEQLHLSAKTIETHRENIKRKLQLASGSELVRHAVQWHMDQAGGRIMTG
ncbi:MAG: response regulator transcription factor [Thiohalocapsa sp.]|jgi:DNA-binding NarL/FixJ family response regulator|uniref:response regulator n=1 Tax=Thiohalocapsa sp. TaxID=2497641 RepID=UPI0025E28DE2|nr:response regulator transcription factor [Thiohalocapsa sp.]MCG6939910.1 response regulator transcription factor [Thiohalocapsa sp.]